MWGLSVFSRKTAITQITWNHNSVENPKCPDTTWLKPGKDAIPFLHPLTHSSVKSLPALWGIRKLLFKNYEKTNLTTQPLLTWLQKENAWFISKDWVINDFPGAIQATSLRPNADQQNCLNVNVAPLSFLAMVTWQ